MIKGILLDLSGTLHVEDQPLPGALEAVARLQRQGFPLRFVTNTSRKSRSMLHRQLMAMGFAIPLEQLVTAPLAVRRYLENHQLRPHLLIHPNLEEEFADLPRNDPDAVVIGYAENAFTYAALNAAFRLLREGARLLATGKNRYFQGKDGLMLDSGPFVRALEEAAETEAIVLGKPSTDFFQAAVADLGCRPQEVVMIGDDAGSDIAGAIAAGLQGILVKTGKYRPGDEQLLPPSASLAEDVAGALGQVAKQHNQAES
jgi:HAD superfamily hydrolase (TIGR01458 family)